MDSKELRSQMKLSYPQLLSYLKGKYGEAKENYFLDINCTRKSAINGRGNEGLFLHHDFEYDRKNPLVNNLSQPDIAKQFDYKYQYAENLTYCNYLEHILLHVKINILRTKQLGRFISDGLVNFMLPEVNDWYKFLVDLKPWQQKAFSLIEDNYSDYCDILEYWLNELYKELNESVDDKTKEELLFSLKRLSKVKK